MKPLTTAAAIVAAVILAIAAPSAAQASSTACRIGDDGITVNQLGEAAQFKSLRAYSPMNCPSARYVLNKWLRRKFARGYSHHLPTNFWDGYVTWHCGKVTRYRWQCREYDSNTRFRFTAWML